jgi:hypothetical protein
VYARHVEDPGLPGGVNLWGVPVSPKADETCESVKMTAVQKKELNKRYPRPGKVVRVDRAPQLFVPGNVGKKGIDYLVDDFWSTMFCC